MTYRFIFVLIIGMTALPVISQKTLDPLERWTYFLGTWEHHTATDTIVHKYEKVLNGQFLKMSTDAHFYSPGAEVTHHTDEGFISWDQSRNVYVFRQFHSEGFINTYVLDDEQSKSDFLVWKSEHVENGYGLKAKLTIEIKNKNEYSMILHLGKEVKSLTACQWINSIRKI